MHWQTRIIAERPAGLSLLVIGLSSTIFLYSAMAVRAQDAEETRKAADTFGAVHGATLRWMERYLKRAVLVTDDDIARLREKIVLMPPDDLEVWLQQTEELRAFVESDAWQETRRWLRDFLKVQAIYSDEELAELQNRIIQASPSQLIEILEDIQDKHRSLRSLNRASDANRRATAQRRPATSTASTTSSSTGRRSTGNRPLFGSQQGQAAQRHHAQKSYRPPPPLINSRQVAQQAVQREVFGPGWWGW